MTDDPDEMRDDEGMDEAIYPVKCDWCFWFGSSEDCSKLRCPNCGGRVTRD